MCNSTENPAVRSSVLLGQDDVTRLAIAWLHTYLQMDPSDDGINWPIELRAARREMLKAVRRAGMYRPNDEGQARRE